MSKPRILLLDIETAPHLVYVWGLFDSFVPIDRVVKSGYTLCWSAKWYGERGVIFDSIKKSGKRKMIRRIYDLMSQADAVVHFNGLRFDILVLNQEFIQLGLTPPPPNAQIDVYQTVKRRFRFASNKLDFVAKSLKLGRKLPHKGMELWTGCMSGDPASWKTMERYNKQDVRLLERVYVTLLPWIKNHPNLGLYALNKPVCSNCGGRHLKSDGFRFANTRKYRRYHCLDCGTWVRQWQSEPGKALMRPAG